MAKTSQRRQAINCLIPINLLIIFLPSHSVPSSHAPPLSAQITGKIKMHTWSSLLGMSSLHTLTSFQPRVSRCSLKNVDGGGAGRCPWTEHQWAVSQRADELRLKDELSGRRGTRSWMAGKSSGGGGHSERAEEAPQGRASRASRNAGESSQSGGGGAGYRGERAEEGKVARC